MKVCTILYTFLPVWIKFCAGYLCEYLWSVCEFYKNRRRDVIYLGVSTNLCPYFTHLLPALGGIQCKISASVGLVKSDAKRAVLWK
jgi:hypothetical protein